MTRSSSSREPFDGGRPEEVLMSPESREVVAAIKRRLGVEVMLPAEPLEVCFGGDQYLTVVNGCRATMSATECYLPMLEEELDFYPPRLVRNAKLKRVILCGELTRSQKPNPSALKRHAIPIEQDLDPLYFSGESTGGLPDVANGILYLPIDAVEDDRDYARKAFHHEFYHCVQWQQFGRQGDSEWYALNSPDFIYGPGGIAACFSPDRTFWIMPAEQWGNGFLSHYSMSAPEEDQAEIYAHLLTEPARVTERLQADDILWRKVERLKSTLNEFCPDVDQTFWQDVEDSRLPFDL